MDRDSGLRMLRDLEELQRVVQLVLDHVNPDALGVGYRLGGTAAALAQGVQLPARDVDILVTQRSDVDHFVAALSRFTCRVGPVWLPDSHQYFARFEVEEIDVEVTTVERSVDTDTFECVGRGPWEHFVQVRLGGHVVPVVRLELRLVSELVRHRPDRYVPLIEHMRMHGVDLPLVRRAMSDRAVDQKIQERTLRQLTGHEERLSGRP